MAEQILKDRSNRIIGRIKQASGGMKKIFLIVALITAFMGSQAYAEDVNWYIGFALGKSEITTGVYGLSGSATLDEEDNGYKLYGGVTLTDSLSIEGHYINFGEASLRGNNGDEFIYDGTLWVFTANNVLITEEVTSLGMSAIASWPIIASIGPLTKFSPYVRFGVHSWDTTFTVASAAGGFDASDDGFDLLYGIGLSVSTADNFQIRAEYETFNIDDWYTDFLSLGVAYSF